MIQAKSIDRKVKPVEIVVCGETDCDFHGNTGSHWPFEVVVVGAAVPIDPVVVVGDTDIPGDYGGAVLKMNVVVVVDGLAVVVVPGADVVVVAGPAVVVVAGPAVVVVVGPVGAAVVVVVGW